MKKILLVLLIPALAFMSSCGGSDDGGIMSQMNKMKEISQNAEEMQEEMGADDSDKVFSKAILAKMDIVTTERKISDEEWNQVIKTIDDFLSMDSIKQANLNHQTINTFFTEHGYANADEGKQELEKIGFLSQFMIEWGMHFVAIKQIQLMDGKDAANQKLTEYTVDINNDGYSKEDLVVIEKNVDYTAKALSVFYTIDNYATINEMARLSDSLNTAELDTSGMNN
ncbi:MAG: hypothetical protein KAG64_06840 [Bacteroidales bacterium]|nr:hypothetical protein [Bacteroidales bacterium]